MPEPVAGGRSSLFAGVELGGTKCICILARDADHVVAEHMVPTTDPATTLAAVEAVLDGWHADHDLAAVGMASFGPLELDPAAANFGHITATTKPGWREADVFSRIAGRYGVPAAIDTDVAGAALAEGRWGAARGLATYAYITVGTGIGAGIIVDGKPVRGVGHAEAGHMHVARAPGDDWPGACIYHGDCVEGLASGFAIEARAGRPPSMLPADDPIWQAVAHALTGLVHNLVCTVAPSRILIGGGVVTRQPHLIPAIRRRLIESLADYGVAGIVAVQIENYIAAPELADRAGPLGAIALAQDAVCAAKEPP